MDSEEEVLVRCCSDQVSGCKEGPREHGVIPEETGTGNLEGNDAQNDIFR